MQAANLLLILFDVENYCGVSVRHGDRLISHTGLVAL